jgi:transcriptional regulator of met regulon
MSKDNSKIPSILTILSLIAGSGGGVYGIKAVEEKISSLENRLLIIETRNTPAKLKEIEIEVVKLMTDNETQQKDINALKEATNAEFKAMNELNERTANQLYEKSKRISQKIDDIQKDITDLRVVVKARRR